MAFDPWKKHSESVDRTLQTLGNIARLNLETKRIGQEQERIGLAKEQIAQSEKRMNNQLFSTLMREGRGKAAVELYNRKIKGANDSEIELNFDDEFNTVFKEGNKLVKVDKKTGKISIEEIEGLEGAKEEEARELAQRGKEKRLDIQIEQERRKVLGVENKSKPKTMTREQFLMKAKLQIEKDPNILPNQKAKKIKEFEQFYNKTIAPQIEKAIEINPEVFDEQTIDRANEASMEFLTDATMQALGYKLGKLTPKGWEVLDGGGNIVGYYD